MISYHPVHRGRKGGGRRNAASGVTGHCPDADLTF